MFCRMSSIISTKSQKTFQNLSKKQKEKLEDLISANPSVDTLRPYKSSWYDASSVSLSWTPMFHILQTENYSLAEKLVADGWELNDDLGFDKDNCERRMMDTLTYFIYRNKTEPVTFMLSHGVNPSYVLDATSHASEYTPLMLAIEQKNVEIVKSLLDHGANPNAVYDDNTVLHYLFLNMTFDVDFPVYKKIYELLLKHGVKYDVPNTDSMLPYIISNIIFNYSKTKSICTWQHMIVATILEHDKRTPNQSVKDFMVMYYVSIGDMNTIHKWRQLGGNLVTNGYDMNVLHVAAQNNQPKILLDVLENNKIDVNYSSDEYETPLYYACNKGNIECIRILLDHGAVITMKILEMASHTGNVKTVTALVHHMLTKKRYLQLKYIMMIADANIPERDKHALLEALIKHTDFTVVKQVIEEVKSSHTDVGIFLFTVATRRLTQLTVQELVKFDKPNNIESDDAVLPSIPKDVLIDIALSVALSPKSERGMKVTTIMNNMSPSKSDMLEFLSKRYKLKSPKLADYKTADLKRMIVQEERKFRENVRTIITRSFY